MDLFYLGSEDIAVEIDPKAPHKWTFVPQPLTQLPSEEAWNFWLAKKEQELRLKDAIKIEDVSKEARFSFLFFNVLHCFCT